MKPGPSPEIIKRIEAIERSALSEAISRLYLVEKYSYRQLCARWNINARTLMRLIRHFGIKPRKGGEAVRAQWLHAPEKRRKKAANIMKQLCAKMKKEGYHPRAGKTKEVDQGAMRVALKLKKSTSSRRPEVRAKNAASHRLVIRRNPPAHATSKALPTRAEQLMIEHIANIGLSPIHNHIVSTELGPRWLNVFISDLNLGIGCEAHGRFPLDWQRHCALSRLGIRLVYITNKRIYRGLFEGLDKYIACVQSVRPHPSAHGQNTVVWGRINKIVFKPQPDYVAIKEISVDKGHALLLTTTPDDPVIDFYLFNRLPS